MLKGGLIGCGFFAHNHLHAWQEIDGVTITALCDRDEARLKEAGDKFGVSRLYTDAAQMIARESLNFVDIATTVKTHRPLVELAASAGLPVICQKPFAENLIDARAMVDACRLAGVPLMVHENFRWQAPLRAVRALLDSDRIGEVFWGRVSFRSAYDVFSGQPYLATSDRFIIEDLGIHILDIARFLFGDVSHLSAATRRINPRIRGEDVATMLMVHESGVNSICDCSYATSLEEELFPQTLLEIDGSRGTIRLSANYELTIHSNGVTEKQTVAPVLHDWASRPWHNIQESVYNIQQHWVACLASQLAPETSGQDNLKTMALVAAAYKSAAGNLASVDVKAVA
ncbi:Gfo/Idh/MocA family protein [Phyllobacterium zundukense]|uniref:Oxidoreductase n=1 Tax=Phyllobacterium zundukense TaxID=1867719 RepID=A0A2N9VZT0_9HYPH|nr:Gfo/Idh/MocA family oxidoreductase [Phyllobacterium zundukense]ATU94362.1 oxidoreductase [Phyllobacterium zundukense]PIO44998.1 oxidoreductase [Phyllobacterium zundukense]